MFTYKASLIISNNTMKEAIKNITHFLIAASVGAFAVIAAERHFGGRVKECSTTVQIDSVKTQVDTSTAVAPDPDEIRPRDTVYIKVYPKNVPKTAESVPEIVENVPEDADSVLYVPVQIEQRVYQDPDSTYRAVVSGPALSEEYGPRLDSIQVFSRNTVQYQTKVVYAEPSRWSFGVTAGMTMTGAGVSPGITLGATYTIWRPKKHKRQ